MLTYVSVPEKISAIVSSTLSVENITIDEDLFEKGVLDSMSLIQLMVELEEGLGIKIPHEGLNVEDYRTVRNMSKLIARLTLISALSKL